MTNTHKPVPVSYLFKAPFRGHVQIVFLVTFGKDMIPWLWILRLVLRGTIGIDIVGRNNIARDHGLGFSWFGRLFDRNGSLLLRLCTSRQYYGRCIPDTLAGDASGCCRHNGQRTSGQESVNKNGTRKVIVRAKCSNYRE